MFIKSIKVFFIISLAVILSSCSIFHRTPPPPKAKLVKFQPTLAVHEIWSQKIGRGTDKHYVKLTPTLAKGNIYAVSYDGTVESLNAMNGRKRWRVTLREPITAGPGVGDGIVVIGTENGSVYALDQQNGRVLWRSMVGSEVLAKPTVTRKMVLIKAGNDVLYALNTKTGKQLWQYKKAVPELILRGGSQAKIYKNMAIAGFSTGQLVAVRLSTGQPVWEQQIAEPKGSANIERMIDINDTPVIVGNRVYVATYQGKLAALNARNGKILWQHDLSAYAGIALNLGDLYISDSNSHVWAFSAKTGHVLWQQKKLFGRYLTGPAVIGDALVVCDAEGYCHFLSFQDGHFVARLRADDKGVIANPVVLNNLVYVYGNSGRLVAYRAG